MPSTRNWCAPTRASWVSPFLNRWVMTIRRTVEGGPELAGLGVAAAESAF
jgi:hypothetical protein